MADEEEKEQEEVVEKTPEEKAAEEKAAEEKVEWDKQRQKVDQAEANVKKIAEEKLALSEQVGAASERAESLQAKVSELESQLADKQTQQEQEAKLDPDLIDPTLIKKIEGLEEKIASEKELLEEQRKEIKDLKEAKAEFLEERKAEKEKADKEARTEKVLGKLDDRYGAKLRNDALKLAQEKVDETGEAPKGELDVYLLLQKCYEELAANAPKETTKKVRVDTGEGSVAFKEGEIKDGNLDEVWKQMEPKIKAKGGLTMPSP